MPVGYEDMFSSSKTESRSDPSGAEVPASMPSPTEVESTVHRAKERAEDGKKSS